MTPTWRVILKSGDAPTNTAMKSRLRTRALVDRNRLELGKSSSLPEIDLAIRGLAKSGRDDAVVVAKPDDWLMEALSE